MTTSTPSAPLQLDPAEVLRHITKRSFCTLATSAPDGRPHAAGVLYTAVDTTLYVNTLRTSRKARDIATNPRVFINVPVRRAPVGPPSTIQFRATAKILDVDDPKIRSLHEANLLKTITSHGELDLPDSCFLQITPASRLHTYGIGMSLLALIRDPLHAAGYTDLPQRHG